MHKADPVEFSDVLFAAADQIEAQPFHPGQALAGVWSINSLNPPEVIIGVIVTTALARVCATRGYDLDRAMRSYLEVSKQISLQPIGTPDKVAVRHLRDAAQKVIEPA
jgi:hypothetical protein